MPVLAPGDVLVSDFPSRLVRIDPSTGRQTTVAFGGIISEAFGVAVERSGDLLCLTRDWVTRIDRASGAFQVLTRGGVLGGTRSKMAVAADGSVLLVNVAGKGRITRVDPHTGAQSQAFAGMPDTFQEVQIVAAPDGGVLMAGTGFPAGIGTALLVRIDLAAGTSAEMFRKQRFRFDGLAVAPDGIVFVVARDVFSTQSALIRFDPATGQQTAVFSRPDVLLNGVALTARGEPLLIGTALPQTTPSRGLLLRLDPGAVTAGTWAAHDVSVGGQLASPEGLAVVPSASG
jgi:sugar lactone lactonase YvrE